MANKEVEESKSNDFCAQGIKEGNLYGICSDEIFFQMKQISNLVVKARLQAKESEIRAKYALEFANKAVAEARSAHQVSDALARTARVVASLALEVSSDAEHYLDILDDLDASITSEDGSYVSESLGTDSCGGNGSGLVTNEIENYEGKLESKFEAVYPSDVIENDTVADILPRDLKENGNDVDLTSPADYESTIDSKPFGATCVSQSSEIKVTDTDSDLSGQLRLVQSMAAHAEKRRMMLYRDSKLLVENVTSSHGTGDAQPASFCEHGTQTEIVT